jgi:hypothetical protein
MVKGDANIVYSDGTLAHLILKVAQTDNNLPSGQIQLYFLNGTKTSPLFLQSAKIEEVFVEDNEAYISGIGIVTYPNGFFVKTPFMLEIVDNSQFSRTMPDTCEMTIGYDTATPRVYEGKVASGDLSISVQE